MGQKVVDDGYPIKVAAEVRPPVGLLLFSSPGPGLCWSDQLCLLWGLGAGG